MRGPSVAEPARVKRILVLAGVSALFLWTLLGLFAWSSVAKQLSAAPVCEEHGEADAQRLIALADEVGALHQDVRALARAMGENFQALDDGLRASQGQHASALEQRVTTLKDELADLLGELEGLRDAVRTAEASETPTQPATPSAPLLAGTTAPVPARPESVAEVPAPATEAAKPRRSFLAFQLPSDDFRFDERRTWSVLPALSRVGFDAKTTLHDFTATTSSVAGELEADLSRTNEAPRAHLVVQAGTLASGDDGRDEAMREHLDVEEHPTLEFELTRFEPAEVDAAAMRASGLAHGRMSVRGVTQEVALSVRLWIDDAHRLCVEGAMALDLRDYEVPVPNKLGLITMEKKVEVWISLRLRANPRSEG